MNVFSPMRDMSAELSKFYETHVRLGKKLRDDLANKRDLNLGRLNTGLDKLAEETGKPHSHYSSYRNQGGYAMRTLNQDPADESDYDIDVAVIFKKDDIPSDPLEARKRVCEALKKSGAKFSKDPEPRTNAVTIWYAEGYHIDFAVFRTYEKDGITRVEHASTQWKNRDPDEVTTWFDKQVNDLSPKPTGGILSGTVEAGQLRRMVRFVKWFCKSRSSWCLPGGMIVSQRVV